LAKHGQKLFKIYSEYNSFLGVAAEASRQVGTAINDDSGFGAMVMVAEVIQLTLGRVASSELESVWNGIGRWQR
jgi:hypothetical protein